MAKIFEIMKNTRTGFINTRFIEKEEMLELHKFSNDIKSWSSGPKLNSRYAIAKNIYKYVYISTDIIDEEEVAKILKEF
jgi:hypothetical protein